MKLAMLFTGLLAGSVAAAAAARSDVPTTQPAPTTRPAEGIAGLEAAIAQLSADDFKHREEAAARIREAGKAALPALKQALESPDPEVQNRAANLIREIEGGGREPAEAAQPDRRLLMRPGIMGMGGGVRIMIKGGGIAVNQQREIRVEENGRSVQIRENADGIKLTVTQTVDGKAVTTEYAARNAEELKKKHPEAHKLYEQYGGRMPVHFDGRLEMEGLEIQLDSQR